MRISGREIGLGSPTYFIADIGSNHEGSLSRAKELIWLAGEVGADCAKFQHYRATHLVSDRGFRELSSVASHQRSWSGSVFEVYDAASVPWNWTDELAETASQAGVAFMSTPYDLEALEFLSPYQQAIKIGSGDVDWLELIMAASYTGKPVLLATGASDLADVDRAMEVLLANGRDNTVLMQCNTNYEGSSSSLAYMNLRVLQTFQARYPGVVLGLSDHSPGHVGVLGAVALGASVVEKHLTDDNKRSGPDHSFALSPDAWGSMVREVRLLEAALGDGMKRVEANEKETRVVQRRAIRAARSLTPGSLLTRDDVTLLRPSPPDSMGPNELDAVIGRTIRRPLAEGDLILESAFDG
jgi:sialic acid synthase SpsE